MPCSRGLGFPVGKQAMAPNGDVVTIVGTGTFSADGKSATGGGTFSHHVAATDTTITGSFTADSVMSFNKQVPESGANIYIQE